MLQNKETDTCSIYFTEIEQKALNYSTKKIGDQIFQLLKNENLMLNGFTCVIPFEMIESPTIPSIIIDTTKKEISMLKNQKLYPIYQEKNMLPTQNLAVLQNDFLNIIRENKLDICLVKIISIFKERLQFYHEISDEYLIYEDEQQKERKKEEQRKVLEQKQLEEKLLKEQKRKEEQLRIEEAEKLKQQKTEDERWNLLKQELLSNVIHFQYKKSTTVKLDVSGQMSYLFDNENRTIILKEITSSFNSNKKYTHIFKYDTGTKLCYYSMNNEPQDLENLYMSIDCSHEFKQLCDAVKDYLDRTIIIDEELLKEIQKVSIIENDIINISEIKGKFEPFKKTHIE